MPHTLILDIDGTLVDSNDAHARAWVKAFAAQGFEVNFEQVRPLIGMGGDQVIPTLTGVQKDDPKYQPLSDGWKAAFEEELLSLRPFAGTRELVQAAQAAGWQTVVATSGEADLAEQLLKLAQVGDLLTERVSSKEVEASKPEPDLIQAAMQKVGATPEQSWMLGDTKYDVEAAHKAGIKCAVVRVGGNPDPEDADVIYDDLNAARGLFTRGA